MEFNIGTGRQHVASNGAICLCCDPKLHALTRKMNATPPPPDYFLSAVTTPAATGPKGSTSTASTHPGRPNAILFQNVRIFDGQNPKLSPPSYVLIVGNIIKTISATPITVKEDVDVTVIDGTGRTLTPGLIDAHAHVMFATVPQMAMLTSDIGFINVAAVRAAEDMLMRGFTTIRDLGGPVFGLKRGIDTGLVPGPRIWPAGAFISQTGGHGDFRFPNEVHSHPGDCSYAEHIGATAIVDDPGSVRKKVREQLALGASHIKMMAGGGVSSNYDPLDVTQFSLEEMRAGVEAAENWGTYVTVHAYTPRAIRQSIAAGVTCIEHGQLLDESTVALMAEKNLWWSLQPFLDDEDATPFAEGTPNRIKQLQMVAGTDTAYALAKQYNIKTAWGTDTLFDAKVAARQGAQLSKLTRWYSSAEVLKMATSTNAELLTFSGLRRPYQGDLGVVKEGALADLLLMEGDPIANIALIEDPATNFRVIMKDGVIYKNTVV